MITIEQPQAFSQRGKREENQDCIFPSPEIITIDDKLFIVCDGVGGGNMGEVASQITCKIFRDFFRHINLKTIDKTIIDQAIHRVQIAFDKFILKNQEARNMATTIALLYLNQQNVIIAHAGDSRVYQFRNEQILYKTDDHSMVNELVKRGQISSKEANEHPQKNMITKAVWGSHIGLIEPDIIELNDINYGDYFFICSDGVFENIPDDTLCKIMCNSDINDSIKQETILSLCNKYSTDNFSAIFFKIK
jgi:protein phosphatase